MSKYDDIVTIFFQGHLSARSVAANYAGTAGVKYITTDDTIEHAFVPNAPPILHNIFTCKDLDDIGYGFTANPLYWILKIKSYVVNTYCGIEGASLAHCYITQDNIAGENDIRQYIDMIIECIRLNPTKKIVLFGCSRGAAATIIVLANLNQSILDHIKLVIVEAPFDSVESVVHNSAWFPTATMNMLNMFTAYKPTQQSPLDAVNIDIFPSIPIAFITSKVDNRVPIENTMNLINILKNKQHPHVHHLVLEKSHHALMFAHNKEDQEKYVHFVNQLYDMYI